MSSCDNCKVLEGRVRDARAELERRKRLQPVDEHGPVTQAGLNALVADRVELRAELEASEKELEIRSKSHQAAMLKVEELTAELGRVRAERDGAKDGLDILSGDCLRLGDDNARLREALENLVEIERRDNLTDPNQMASDTWREQAWDEARAALDGGEEVDGE